MKVFCCGRQKIVAENNCESCDEIHGAILAIKGARARRCVAGVITTTSASHRSGVWLPYAGRIEQ